MVVEEVVVEGVVGEEVVEAAVEAAARPARERVAVELGSGRVRELAPAKGLAPAKDLAPARELVATETAEPGAAAVAQGVEEAEEVVGPVAGAGRAWWRWS